MDSTAGFPDVGAIIIGNETFNYTSKDALNFISTTDTIEITRDVDDRVILSVRNFRTVSGGTRYEISPLVADATYVVDVTPISTLGNRGTTASATGTTGNARIIGEAGAQGDSISIGPITMVDDTTQFDVINTNGTTTTLSIPNGSDGVFSRTIYRRLIGMPPTPVGGSLAGLPDAHVPPPDWFFVPPTGTDQLWKAVVTFVPGGDNFEETCITYSGTTGTQTGTPAVFEAGFFDVSGTPGLDIEEMAEVSTVTTTGVSASMSGTPAVSEDGFFDVSGTPGTDIVEMAEVSTVTSTGVSGIVTENPAVSEDGFFDVSGTPGTNVTARAEVSTVTAEGISGEVTENPAVFEDGFFDVSGTPGTDITARAEVSTVTTAGTSGTLTQTAGMTEIQTITQSGTRSNVTSGSEDRTITLSISDDTFNTGSSQTFLEADLGTSITTGTTPTTVDNASGNGLDFPATGMIWLANTSGLTVTMAFRYTSRTANAFTGALTQDTGSAATTSHKILGALITAENLGSVVQGTNNAWPTSVGAGFTIDNNGWTYEPALSTSFGNTDYSEMPRIIKTGGSNAELGVNWFSITVTVDDDSLGTSVAFSGQVFNTNSNIDQDINFTAVSDGNEYTGTSTFSSGEMPDKEQILWRISAPSGTSYTVTRISLIPRNNDGVGLETSRYTLDLDSGNSLTPNGAIIALFGDEQNSVRALEHLKTAIGNNWATTEVTTGDVTPSATSTVYFAEELMDVRDFRGQIRDGGWDITRNFGNFRSNDDRVEYFGGEDYGSGTVTGWDAWINPVRNNWFGVAVRDPNTDWVVAGDGGGSNNEKIGLNQAVSQGVLSNSTLTITDNADSNLNVTFAVRQVKDTHTNASFWFELESIISQSGTPPLVANGGRNVEWLGEFSLETVNSSSLDVVTTGSTTDVTAMLSIVANRGTAATTITSADAAGVLTGTPSTYTVTTNEGVITMFDSSVPDTGSSDLAAVNTNIMNIVDGTDFFYNLSGNDIIIDRTMLREIKMILG